MGNRLDKILENAGYRFGEVFVAGAPRTCMVWYNTKKGSIHDVSDAKPANLHRGVNEKDISSINLMYDEHGPRPELGAHVDEDFKVTPAIKKVMRQIAQYRHRKYGEALPND